MKLPGTCLQFKYAPVNPGIVLLYVRPKDSKSLQNIGDFNLTSELVKAPVE